MNKEQLTISTWNGTFDEWEDTRLATNAEVLAYAATLDGELIGAEPAHGTCGHCGGRSLDPSRRRNVATVTTGREPDAEVLGTIRAAYVEEGFENVELVPMPATEHEAGPWETKVFASGNPYARAAV